MEHIIKKCLFCKQEFNADKREHNRGNAKYCNLSCQCKHRNSIRPLRNCTCMCCKDNFQSVNTKAKYCSNKCKTKYYRLLIAGTDDVPYAFRYVLPTLSCANCNWKEAPRDIHHIVSLSKGGKHTFNNLITLCPNCHRLAHRKLLSKYKLRKLVKSRTISSSLINKEMDALAGN
jgi:5-methylcytosine-specific restriction endonuclease McrA